MALCCFHHHSRFLCLCLLSSLKNLYLKGHLPRIDEAIRHQNQICRAGLSLLSEPFTMHPSQSDSPRGSDSTSRASVSSLASCTTTSGTKAFKPPMTNVLASRDTLQSIVPLDYAKHATKVRQSPLQHVFTATALNFARISAWLSAVPPAQTRQAAFVRLAKKGAS